MKKVLILGASGMLGTMVSDLLSKEIDIQLKVTVRREFINLNKIKCKINYFDAKADVKTQLDNICSEEFVPDYVINCIGIIKPYCKKNDPMGIYDAIYINALFPYKLAEYFNHNYPLSKIIQIATDCVYKGDRGYYNENHGHDSIDVYGKTKSLGEVIKHNFLNIRCSIIGPELRNNLSLMEWFLNQKEGTKVLGYDHHIWNGVTTLQFAKLCNKIIKNDSFSHLRKLSPILHYVVNEDITKYQLLNLLKKQFNHKITIEKTNTIGNPINRTLRSRFLEYELSPMDYAIQELKEYMVDSLFYKKKIS